MPWRVRQIDGFLVAGTGLLAGCGSPVVDADMARSPLPPAAIAPPAAVAEQVPASDVTNPPQVAAEKLIAIPPEQETAYYHTVAPGETLSALARRYGTTVEILLDANGLNRAAVLQPGQMIYIPGREGMRSQGSTGSNSR